MLFFFLGNLNQAILFSLLQKKSGSVIPLNTFGLTFFFSFPLSVFLAELIVKFQDPGLNLITSFYQVHVVCANFGRNSYTVPGKTQLSCLWGPVQGIYISFCCSATDFILILPAHPLSILSHQPKENSRQFTILHFNIFQEELSLGKSAMFKIQKLILSKQKENILKFQHPAFESVQSLICIQTP